LVLIKEYPLKHILLNLKINKKWDSTKKMALLTKYEEMRPERPLVEL
jgi:hypothetical protein